MFKFFKKLYTPDVNAGIGDVLLTIALWMITIIGGGYTIGEVGRALTAYNAKLGFEFGIGCFICLIGIFLDVCLNEWFEEERTYKQFKEDVAECERELEAKANKE